MRIFVKLSSSLVFKLLKSLQQAAINWIEKGILANFLEILFISSFLTSSAKFNKFDVGNRILFQIKVNLDNKNRTFKNFPTGRLKDVSDICSPILANIWNDEILLDKNFPENLILANVSPIFKKKDETFLKITYQ